MIIYDTLYNLLNTYIYGAPEVLTELQDLTLTMLSTCGSVFVCALPLACCFWTFRFVCTLGSRW